MSSEWSATRLRDLVSIKHGFAFKGDFFVDEETPLQLTTPGNFAIGGGFQCGKGKYYAGPVPSDDVLQTGDLIVTMTDLSKAADTLGYAAVVPNSTGTTWLHNQRVGLVRSQEGVNVHMGYIHYLMRSPDYRHWVVSTATGSTVKHTSPDRIISYEFLLPSLAEQREIGETLAALDDRITLLRETNATLEAIAQALFKSWFVDFDPARAKAEGRQPEGMDVATAALFPDSFEESELGLVPRGWKVEVLAKYCDSVESGGTPKRTVPEFWEGDIPWLTSGEVRNPIVFDTKEKISSAGVKESSAKLWPRGTTVVAMYGATAGEACLLADPSTANQACCGLIPNSYSRTFLFMYVRREKESLASKSSGSAQQNLNKALVSNHPALLATDKVLMAYESQAGVILDRWIANERENKTITQLRDTLLPRLISGQLRLPDAMEAIADTLPRK